MVNDSVKEVEAMKRNGTTVATEIMIIIRYSTNCHAHREQQLFNRKEIILVGTNAYQNEKVKMDSELQLYPFLKTNTRKTVIEPILEKRLAEEVEQKRLKDE